MSSLSPFDLLTEIGRDCVGVLQLLLDGEAPGNIKQIETDAVSEDDMAELPAGFPERVESQYWRDLGS